MMAKTGLGSNSKDKLDAWVTSANKAIELKQVHSTDRPLNSVVASKDKDSDEARRTFHPEFTYPFFGEEEVLFGFKNPVVRLHYAAGSLFTFLGMSYTYKIDNDPDEMAKSKRLGGVAPTADNVLSIIQEKLPEKGYTDNYSLFMDHVRRDESGGFVPMGEKIYEYSVKGCDTAVYEVYKTSFSSPRFKVYNAFLQVFLLLFIEGASAIDDEDDAWECHLTFEKRRRTTAGATPGHDYSYSLVGFSTVYAFWCFPDGKRMRISQFLIMPPFQKQGHGKQLYNAMKRDFVSRKEVTDFGVEDPNEDFSNLRDICDIQFLLAEVERIKSFGNTDQQSVSLDFLTRPAIPSASNVTGSSTNEAIDKVVENIKSGIYKLSKAQGERCIEMIRLKFLDRSNKAAAKDFRLLVKRRLYKRNEEALSGMDSAEMQEKLQETFLNVEEGYRDILKHSS
ncbi:acyl-CoA N-acyltransferase [Obelidium mucronatum]|nr:acyl-CoA N-acyltransferase [Obelidium mucronatum]